VVRLPCLAVLGQSSYDHGTRSSKRGRRMVATLRRDKLPGNQGRDVVCSWFHSLRCSDEVRNSCTHEGKL
jgi:hypothetical protein